MGPMLPSLRPNEETSEKPEPDTTTTEPPSMVPDRGFTEETEESATTSTETLATEEPEPTEDDREEDETNTLVNPVGNETKAGVTHTTSPLETNKGDTAEAQNMHKEEESGRKSTPDTNNNVEPEEKTTKGSTDLKTASEKYSYSNVSWAKAYVKVAETQEKPAMPEGTVSGYTAPGEEATEKLRDTTEPPRTEPEPLPETRIGICGST